MFKEFLAVSNNTQNVQWALLGMERFLGVQKAHVNRSKKTPKGIQNIPVPPIDRSKGKN